MRRFLKLSVILLTALIAAGCSKSDVPEDPEQPEGPTTSEEVDAIAYAQSLGIGWNLGNSLDAHSNGKSNETCWGNGKATQATFNAVKSMGFSSVRIPVTWMGHIGSAPDYKIEDAWLNRVAEVAGYAKKAGLKAIINIHHDGSASNSNNKPSYSTGVWLRISDAIADNSKDAAIKAEITNVWKQIATRFKDEGDWLIFETFNEIHDGMWGFPITNDLLLKMNQWNQTALDAIRSAGGENVTRFVGIPCYAANPAFTKTTFALPQDKAKNRLMVAVHTYDPFEYAGAASTSEWGHTANTTNSAYKETSIGTVLNTLETKYVSCGIPVYFGEFGCVHRGTVREENFRKYYLEYNIRNMRMHNMPVMIWDNGAAGSGEEKFGLINHADGSYIRNTDVNDTKEVIELMVNAWNSDDTDYTLESIYNRAPR